MPRLLRFVALANAIYEGAVGLSALLSPEFVSSLLFQLGVLTPFEAAIVRLLGALLCGNAMMLVLVSRQGRRARMLARWAFASGVVNLFAEVAVCLGKDLPWSDLMASIVAQAALVLVLIAWLGATHRAAVLLEAAPKPEP